MSIDPEVLKDLVVLRVLDLQQQARQSQEQSQALLVFLVLPSMLH
jgi:hypothetical protein